jgi:hypothetical protein
VKKFDAPPNPNLPQEFLDSLNVHADTPTEWSREVYGHWVDEKKNRTECIVCNGPIVMDIAIGGDGLDYRPAYCSVKCFDRLYASLLRREANA